VVESDLPIKKEYFPINEMTMTEYCRRTIPAASKSEQNEESRRQQEASRQIVLNAL